MTSNPSKPVKTPQHTPFNEPQENLRNAHTETERRNPLHFVVKLS